MLVGDSNIIPSRHGQCYTHGPPFPNLLDSARLLEMHSGREFQLWNGLGPLIDRHMSLSGSPYDLGRLGGRGSSSLPFGVSPSSPPESPLESLPLVGGPPGACRTGSPGCSRAP